MAAYNIDTERGADSNATAATPVADNDTLRDVDAGAIEAFCIPPVRALPAAGASVDMPVRRLYHALKLGRSLAEFGIALPSTAAPAPRGCPARSTFPGSTTFKVLCNSFLRKTLRGQAPDALYRIAHAILPNGDRVIARLRLTVTIEDICVEAALPLAPPGDSMTAGASAPARQAP